MTVPGRQYGSISFIVGLESQDPQVRQQAEAKWRSHAARAGHKRRVRKHAPDTSIASKTSTLRPSSPVENSIPSQIEIPQIFGSDQNSLPKLYRCPSLFHMPESADLLQFWLMKAAPFLVRGRPSHRGVLSVLVPSASLSSGIVSHIMMSHALTHQALIQAPSAQRTDLDQKALAHYTAAISAMRTFEATTVEKLLTSCLGWTIEGLQGNLDRSKVHLDGLQALVEIGEQDFEIRQQFKPFLAHAKAVHAAVWERLGPYFASSLHTEGRDVADNWIYNSDSTRRIEQSYTWIISHISASRSRQSVSAIQPEDKIHDGIGEWLQSYVELRSSWQAGSMKGKPEDILRLLNDVVTTLLPHDVVADVAPVDIDSPERVLATVESCFNPMLQGSLVDYIQLLGTLRVVLDLSLELWPTEPWRTCIQSLLRAVDVCEKSCLPGTQQALPTRRKAPKKRVGKV